jgi:hypothetical protein
VGDLVPARACVGGKPLADPERPNVLQFAVVRDLHELAFPLWLQLLGEHAEQSRHSIVISLHHSYGHNVMKLGFLVFTEESSVGEKTGMP